MGRHRRSARATADEAATNARTLRAPLTSQPTGTPTDDPSEAVTQPLPVVRPGPAGAGRHRSPHRGARRRKGTAATAAPLPGGTQLLPKAGPRIPAPARRAGLLGASAAVAMSAAAMVSGLLPAGVFTTGGPGAVPGPGTGGQVRADGLVETPPQRSRPAVPTPTDHPGSRPGTARTTVGLRRDDDGTGDGSDGTETVVHMEAAAATVREDARAGRNADRAAASDTAQATAEAEAEAAARAEAESEAKAEARAARAAGAAAGAAAGREAAARKGAARHSRTHVDGDSDASAATVHALADSRSAAAHLVVALVNAERAKAGCRPLRADAGLARLAQSFSDDMARRQFFDHTDPDGRTPWDRAARRGVRNLGGENIARGHPDPRSVVDAWMRSSGHRANILNCDYKRIGVGVHQGSNGPWWTQDFGY
ncbi:hypothetical protein GCM10010218_33540 [Streptomyces mashuensis]|uniref:SCP domain-containing protein n=1 Tax=Streptomyces mashuensis TaxID=33904 RepID=A0A919B424_9ACTN|nr:CAP domain-containing protein [Streptomyces mashuensis]GHF49526.1 hypothetical protein GCM10010218_33540 [Streptomyces mashuensis]